MLPTLLLLPLNLIVLNTWLWLFENIFELKEQKKTIILLTISMGIIGGLGIFFYPKLVSLLGVFDMDFTSVKNYNFKVFLLFWIYLSVLLIIFKIIVKSSFSKFFAVNFVVFTILFFVGAYFGLNFFTKEFLIYYIFVAFGEEFVKYILGSTFYDKYKIFEHDIIIFSILSALGFAFIENIIYLIGGVTHQPFFQAILGGVALILARGLVGFFVHVIFTGNIGLIQGKNLGNKLLKLIFIVAISITVGVGLHYAYDMLLYIGFKLTIFIAIVGGYFWMSYLFYVSDRLYIKDGLN